MPADISKGKARVGSRSSHSKLAGTLVNTFLEHHESMRSRMATGKAVRDRVSRLSHGNFKRTDTADPLSILLAQARTRLPQLVPIRHARMLVSPFAFLRGSAAVMAADLATNPTTGFTVQACGDMHVSNFGVFGSVERQLIFAINDFDETMRGPWEWDVKRLAASAYVASSHLDGNRTHCQDAAWAVVSSYQQHLRSYAHMGYLETWYDTIDSDKVLESLSPEWHDRANTILDKARTRTHLQVLEKMTDLVDDRHRIIENRPFIVRERRTFTGRSIKEALGHFLKAYLDSLSPERQLLLSNYRIVDVVRKVVGVGSVGTGCWVVMLQGEDFDDPLFLQIKEAQPSVLAPYLPSSVSNSNEGQRVVNGQRLIQGSSDIFLGWGELDDTHFYVRQLRDMKGGVNLEPGVIRPTGFVEYCRLCGWGLALAHAKSGDPAMISGYIGKSDEFVEAIVHFAGVYAEQTERDYDTLAAAAKNGKLKVAARGY
ncbi:MAG TPA: DUF2252 domain-containing protein [Edaphobacter sp.]|jgi:uncharacterized protein (DUF2252 family)|nr:DUF2252 domain-containing protein [Edaphobacter sp.]